MQSGKPVAVFETHEQAPRVLIANSNLVPEWATWEHFRELDAAGLMMYGQMTAGSWIYIGSQGILQGTYETFAAAARKRFGGTLARAAGGDRRTRRDGRRAAARDHDAAAAPRCASRSTCSRIERRLETGYLDERAADLDDALARLRRRRARAARRCRSACSATPPRSCPSCVRRGVARRRRHRPDQRARPAQRLRPAGPDRRAGRRAARAAIPTTTCARVGESALAHVGAIRALRPRGRRGVRLRQRAARAGRRARRRATRSPTPGFVPAYIRPLFCEGKGPFRWVALSGDPRGHPRAPTEAILDLFGDQEHIARWIRLARREGPLPGAAGADLLARLRRARTWPALRFNEMVASGELQRARS